MRLCEASRASVGNSVNIGCRAFPVGRRKEQGVSDNLQPGEESTLFVALGPPVVLAVCWWVWHVVCGIMSEAFKTK